MTIRRAEGRTAHWYEFSVLEQAALCLKALVLEAGGTVIIATEDIDAMTGTIDIKRLDNGDVRVQILAPGE